MAPSGSGSRPTRSDMIGHFGRGARRLGVAALDLLLPANCATCDAPVDAPGRLCSGCFSQTGFVTEPCCACCGVPFATVAQGGPDTLCPRCRAAPPEFGRARAALRYDGHARRMILPFKHADRTEMAAALAPLMARAGAALLREAEVLVPVPLHRSRLLQRRYNQAVLLARALARIARVPALPDAMIRSRRTAPLGERSAAERYAEVADAFAVRPSRAARVAGRRVILVDDVMTSGATANACAFALKAAVWRAWTCSWPRGFPTRGCADSARHRN
jgi:ComF family protein